MLAVLLVAFVELVFGGIKFTLVRHNTTASHCLVQASR